jgi:hypothetical protein
MIIIVLILTFAKIIIINLKKGYFEDYSSVSASRNEDDDTIISSTIKNQKLSSKSNKLN